MKLRVSAYMLQFVASAWMCVEIGQFFETRTGLGGNALFWPLWISIVLVFLLAAIAMDLKLSK